MGELRDFGGTLVDHSKCHPVDEKKIFPERGVVSVG